jgi:hypothetical protein
MIVMAGLPRSGNHVIREHILRCIRRWRGLDESKPHEKVAIWHGTQQPPRFDEKRTRFVIPVRDRRWQQASLHGKPELKPAQFPTDGCIKGVMRAVLALNASVYYLSYEAFVADPNGVTQDLMRWLGYPWVPFPEGPASPLLPHSGPPFDGNEKYRCAAPQK